MCASGTIVAHVPQDDQLVHDVNFNIHNDLNDSLMYDDPGISHRQHDSTDHPPSENSDGFDPGDLDEYEQQDAMLQAESQARAAAIQALSISLRLINLQWQ